MRDPAGQCLDFYIGDRGNQSRLEYKVRQRSRLAQQDVSGGFLFRRDSRGPYTGVTNRARPQACATRAAVTRFAAVGEVQSGGERRFQHRLPFAHSNSTAVRVDADTVLV